MRAHGAADRFWLELLALYQAAGKPTLKRLVSLGMEQRPPVPVSDSTINGWLNGKAVPTGRKNEHYLAVMVSFLQARTRTDSQYEPLSEGEWGRLLREAQTERSAGKKNGRPRLAAAPSRGADAYGQWQAAAVASTRAAQPGVPVSRRPVAAADVIARHDDGLGDASPDVLIGRDSELATLAGLVQTVAAGGGGTVLIEGEPGIGKSALVRAALAGATGLGCHVFWGAGDELDLALPLQPLLDGLRVRELSAHPRRHAIARLLRGEAVTDRGADVSAVLAEQLLALVAECCAVRPTVLVFDDLQWADQASITLWGRLARSARQMPLLLVGVMRPVPRRDGLLALRRVAGGVSRLRLTPLTRPAVADLVAALAGGKPDGSLLELADGAAGNPLYVTELVAALMRSGAVTITDSGVAALTAGSVPCSLSEAIADRLGFVEGPVREVLRAAALLGVEFAVSDLGTVLGRTARDLACALEEACAVGVLAASGNRLGFRHPLIRTALYDEMPMPVRAALHHDAGRALAEAGASADRVARQMLRASGEPGGTAEPMDEWMLTWLTRTADLLLGQAPGVAAELLTRAVASSSPCSVQHGWLASRLADALYRIGLVSS